MKPKRKLSTVFSLMLAVCIGRQWRRWIIQYRLVNFVWCRESVLFSHKRYLI